MIYTETTTIESIALHRVGNKSADEGCHLSHKVLRLTDELQEVLLSYFLVPFKSEEYYRFCHETDLNMNEVYTYVSKIFENSDNLLEQSGNLANYLYAKSIHPNIKSGDFYVVYFKECELHGETVNAVGLFKSEIKDTFLKVLSEDDNFYIESEIGINIKKLDKGCLIFNQDAEKGLKVAAIDNTNRGLEAQYWMDDFLHIKPMQDDFHHTQNLMMLTKNFVTQELPKQFNVSRADEASMLHESMQFFKEKEDFTMGDFEDAVIKQPEVIESFQTYRQHFTDENDLQIPDSFELSAGAVRQQSRGFKSIIKLDKNFHIYVHGDSKLIEQGEDENGKFYKLYYHEEH